MIYAVISGLLLTASFYIPSFSFFSLVPLFKKDTSFKKGFIAGIFHYATLLYWLPYPLTKYAEFSFYLSLIPYLLLCLYLSLYLGMFCFLCRRTKRWDLFLIPSYWTGLEFIKGKLLTGFPWCLLGYTQYRNLYLIQIADVAGVYGISFLIVMINLAIYKVIKERSLREGVFTMTVLFFVYGYGYLRIHKPINGKNIAVSVIQGNIDQAIKWDPRYQEKIVNTYLQLTRSSYKFKPDLIIWPETAVPFYFQEDGRLAEKIINIPKESNAILIFGSPAYRISENKISYYNRAYLLSQNRILFYDKVHLVPFGEYVPLRRLFFFMKRIVNSAGDFSPGDRLEPLKIKDLSVGIMICFEEIFPEIAREHVRHGANLLVNITNDAWFGKTAAPYQHFIMSVFRAVENRRYLVRCANTGISAFIDPYGRIIKRSYLFKREILFAKIRLVKEKSFYTRFGDIFVYVISLVSLIKIRREF